ncbi:hypothetical protein QCA50_013881 [Cerrena zonata]|uniref:N-acetyltransferase domain-containing protein n=1 Tax=Cerrena zonata TaxID=2478898 RepID=A0AAW0FZW5_9APHY
MPTDLSSLSLYPATDDQKIESRRRSYVEWNRGLSLEHYLRRDELMYDDEHAREYITTWVLAPRDDPKTLDFMCSCETFRRPAIVAKATEKGPQVQDVIGYGIASVFTPETRRGKGYAKHMMRLLHWIISPPSTVQFPSSWGAPPTSPIGNASFSVLYSDVGPTFYSHCGPDNTPGTGWTVRGNRQTRWDLHAELPVPLSSVHGEILSEEQVNELWEDDAKIIKVEAR